MGASVTTVCSTLSELAEVVTPALQGKKPPVVGVDGIDGAGKTHLVAKPLAELILAKVVSLDRHLIKKRGGFIPFLRCQSIRAAIEVSDQNVIVEGVCLLAAAARCGFRIDIHVYVKRLEKDGRWADEDLCLGLTPAEKLIEEDLKAREAHASIFGGDTPENPLYAEVAEYHQHYKPVEAADVIFEVVKHA